MFTLGAWAPCLGSILRRAPMWTHLFSWYPRQNSGTVPVPEYKVSTLYSGTKLGTESLCEHIFRWCPGTLPTNHLFSYPQFLVPLEISIVSVCSVYWMWTYLQTGYRVSEHSTILCRCPGTSARAPSVNTALVFTGADQKFQTEKKCILELFSIFFSSDLNSQKSFQSR